MINNLSPYKAYYQAQIKPNGTKTAVIKPFQSCSNTVSFGSKFFTPKEIIDFSNELSPDILKTHLFKIASPETCGRGVGSRGIEIAKNYIAEQFKALNLEPVKQFGLNDFFQEFQMGKYTTSLKEAGKSNMGMTYASTTNNLTKTANVLGMIRGYKNPEGFLILTAHYDHLGKLEGKNIVFPGADDNASSVSALLEIARIMKAKGPHEKSIIFAALSGEEFGKFGAMSLARKIFDAKTAKHTEIVNVEMIGATGGELLDIWKGRTNLSENIVKSFEEAGKALNVKTETHKGMPCCDGQIFSFRQLPTITTTWDYKNTKIHPHYHTPKDTPENVNMTAFEKAAKVISAACYVLANKTTDAPTEKRFTRFLSKLNPFKNKN